MKQGYNFWWNIKGDMYLEQNKFVFVCYLVIGVKIWFNQVYNYNNIYENFMLRFIGVDILDDKMLWYILYGNGRDIELEVL